MAVTVAPAAPRSTIDACTVTVTGASQNDTGAVVPANYPVQAEKRYYLRFLKAGVEKGRSYLFGVDENGGHVFPNYIFPESGTFVVHLVDSSNSSSVQNSGNVTVS